MSDNLESLDQSRTDWSITVRVTRSWHSFDNNGNFSGLNYILLDAQNYHVHAFVRSLYSNAFENVIFAGNIYQINNFIVREANGVLRPVSSTILLILTQFTIVQPVFNNPITPIPMHKFEVVELGDLYDIARSYPPNQMPTNAIDVAGIVENLEPPMHISTHFGERHFVRFRIYDGRTSVKVAFWDEEINILDALINGNFENPPIVVLSAMRLKLYQERVQISGIRASRLFIDIEYEAVGRIRQRLTDQGYRAPHNAN